MNDSITIKTCEKHGPFQVSAKNKGWCVVCYPFPRVYCCECKQPLTNLKHRARGYGARCAKVVEAKEKEHMKEDVDWTDTGGVDYMKRCYPDSDGVWSDDF